MSTDDLKEIERLGGLLFSPEQVATIMELDLDGLPEAQQAYNRGRLMREAAIREIILEMAAQGSAPAQALAMGLIQKQTLDGIIKDFG